MIQAKWKKRDRMAILKSMSKELKLEFEENALSIKFIISYYY